MRKFISKSIVLSCRQIPSLRGFTKRAAQLHPVISTSVSCRDVLYKKTSINSIRIDLRKVKVDQTTWADYIFEPAYKLPSLQQVEQFIYQHKHLPEVPSAKEVDENGLNVGTNQAVLLKKIEELTLYIIEQNKKIEKLEKQNSVQEQLTQKLEALEQQIKELKAKN